MALFIFKTWKRAVRQFQHNIIFDLFGEAQQRQLNVWFCLRFAEGESSKFVQPKEKREKSAAKLISPQLLACKIETNKVEFSPALRQRSIQLQALNAKRSSAELLLPQAVTMQSVENDLRHRKKAVIVEDINNHRCGNTSSSSAGTTSDDDCGPEESGKFDTHLVIEFSSDIQKKTLHWIIDKIRLKVTRGGAGLDIRREPQTECVINFTALIQHKCGFQAIY